MIGKATLGRQRHLAVLALALISTVPMPGFAQNAPTAVDIFQQVGFGRRTDHLIFESLIPPGNGSTGFLRIDVSSIPISAIDANAKITEDWFCVGSEISLNIPGGRHFESLDVRFWPDYGTSDVVIQRSLPDATTGSWSKGETVSWHIDGNIGFFGPVVTGGVSAGVAFANSKNVSYPGLVVRKFTGTQSKNDPAWSFTVADSTMPIAEANSPTLEFFTQFLVRARSAGVRPRFAQSVAEMRLQTLKLRGGATTTDGLPGLRFHMQAKLKTRGDLTTSAIWESSVKEFVIPFASLPPMPPPDGSGLALYNDGGDYFEKQQEGKWFAIVTLTEESPARWETDTADSRMEDEHWNTLRDLDRAKDWVTPGRPREIGGSNFLQVSARSPDRIVMGGGTIRQRILSVKLTRNEGLPASQDGPNPRLIPTSVLFDLLAHGTTPLSMHASTFDWLTATGWTYQVWQSRQWGQGEWLQPVVIE